MTRGDGSLLSHSISLDRTYALLLDFYLTKFIKYTFRKKTDYSKINLTFFSVFIPKHK